MKTKTWPILGVGVGLRPTHYPYILEHWPRVDFFEIISENYMDSGGRPRSILRQIRERYPVVMHGVSLSIGSTDPLNWDYLKKLKQLIDEIDPPLVSDHLCWTGAHSHNLHDLLPLPYTQEALVHVVSRVKQVQDFLGRRILLENVSSYLSYAHSEMSEWAFIGEIAKTADCGILLDVNNVYVNAYNHKFKAEDYIDAIDPSRVGQYHLAGHTDKGTFLFDTHIGPIIENVWKLYAYTLTKIGDKSTLIEWDEHIPEFPVLEREALEASRVRENVCGNKRIPAVSPRVTPTSPSITSTSPSVIHAPFVIPAKAGIHSYCAVSVDPRLRGDDKGSGGDKGTNRQGTRPPILETLQDWVTQLMMHPSEPPSAIEVISPKLPLTLIQTHSQDGPASRLSVYRDGYYARITDALNATYEAVAKALGEKNFYDLTIDYIRTYPSQQPNINLVGEHLPSYLKDHPSSHTYPFLPDLAQFEWRFALTFNATDRETLTPQHLARLTHTSAEHLQLHFQPSVHLIRSDWRVYDIWKARAEVSPPSDLLVRQSQYILMFRPDTDVTCERLTPQQYEILDTLMQGKTMGQAFEHLDSDQPSPSDIQQWFATWLHWGIFASSQID